MFNPDLDNWVKTKSTTWYFHFLLSQYNGSRWIEDFRISKVVVNLLISNLNIQWKRKTWNTFVSYLKGKCIACSLYKLIHGAKYFHCSEIFVIESWYFIWFHESSYMLILFFNITSKAKGRWLGKVMVGFKTFLVHHLSMVPLISLKFTFKNWEVHLQEITFHSNLKFITCSYKLWLTRRNN